MGTKLSDAGKELFDNLTSRTFFVVDTEYTSNGDGGNSIISIAIVPVVHGRRVDSPKIYFEMNPGVPISKESTQVHGFTDATVSRKRQFSTYAPKILKLLSKPNAVFVAHTSSDIRVLRDGLRRLDERKLAGDKSVTKGLEDLPVMPVIDTSTLAKSIHYEGVGNRAIVSLGKLCELTGVTNKRPHNALSDARATADALIELLAHAAQNQGISDLSELLNKHRGGSTDSPRGSIHFRERDSMDIQLPAEHLAKHYSPITEVIDKKAAREWAELAFECASLRCQSLSDEAAIAGNLNAPLLLEALKPLLSKLNEPGQAGTLVGAISELIKPTERDGNPGFLYTGALQWWRKFKPELSQSKPCGDTASEQCPACREGDPCPRDTVYQLVAISALLGRSGALTRPEVTAFFKPKSISGLSVWSQKYKEIAAYAAWYLIDEELKQNRGTPAVTHINAAERLGLHLAEPRMAKLQCETWLQAHRTADALTLARSVLANRTTDLGYSELEDWVAQTEQSIQARAKAVTKAPSNHPRRARPQGRENENPYKVI